MDLGESTEFPNDVTEFVNEVDDDEDEATGDNEDEATGDELVDDDTGLRTEEDEETEVRYVEEDEGEEDTISTADPASGVSTDHIHRKEANEEELANFGRKQSAFFHCAGNPLALPFNSLLPPKPKKR